MNVPGSYNSEAQKQNFSGFAVIVAGLPRTGTMSMRSALGILLDGACYHMTNIGMGGKKEMDFWNRALDGKEVIKKEEWVEFLQGRGFRAGVDHPIAIFYRELMDAFPDAKVVLTVRDPEKWFESVKNSILKNRLMEDDFAYSLCMRLMGREVQNKMVMKADNHVMPGFDIGIYDVVEVGKEASVAFFNKWVEQVKQTVPKERLLVFDVRQGWKPLCEFMDLPIPEEPFPNANDSKSINDQIGRQKMLSYFIVYAVPAILIALFVYLFK